MDWFQDSKAGCLFFSARLPRSFLPLFPLFFSFLLFLTPSFLHFLSTFVVNKSFVFLFLLFTIPPIEKKKYRFKPLARYYFKNQKFYR